MDKCGRSFYPGITKINNFIWRDERIWAHSIVSQTFPSYINNLWGELKSLYMKWGHNAKKFDSLQCVYVYFLIWAKPTVISKSKQTCLNIRGLKTVWLGRLISSTRCSQWQSCPRWVSSRSGCRVAGPLSNKASFNKGILVLGMLLLGLSKIKAPGPFGKAIWSPVSSTCPIRHHCLSRWILSIDTKNKFRARVIGKALELIFFSLLPP